MQRKLASVQRVRALITIEGADRIELARIEGWNCVVKKGEFAVGDPGVFFEIDAIPPDLPLFRFLWTPKATLEGEVVERPARFRIRTMRLRGQLSQGLLLPLSMIAEADAARTEEEREQAKAALDVLLDDDREAFWAGFPQDLPEGFDLTAYLGVSKYEPPAPAGMGDFRALFPGVLPKTDEMRVQSVPEVLEEMSGLPYAITLKYDGTSASFLVNPLDNEFHVCGRNFSIREGDNLYWEIARKYDLRAKLTANPRYALQGEIVGPGIQKNPLALKERSLFVFNVYDLEAGAYLGHDDAREVIAWLGLAPVDTIAEGAVFDATQDDLLKLAEGKYPGTTNEREGIVIRPKEERQSATLGGRLSFKAISNAYLLKEE